MSEEPSTKESLHEKEDTYQCDLKSTSMDCCDHTFEFTDNDYSKGYYSDTESYYRSKKCDDYSESCEENHDCCEETDECKIKYIRGPRGKRGPRGCPGPRGKRGCPGPRGKRGCPGPRGCEGKRGPRGCPGPRGKRGPRGCPGPKGKRGPRGCPGPKGKRGPRGRSGDINLSMLVCEDTLLPKLVTLVIAKSCKNKKLKLTLPEVKLFFLRKQDLSECCDSKIYKSQVLRIINTGDGIVKIKPHKKSHIFGTGGRFTLDPMKCVTFVRHKNIWYIC